jgi:aspartate/methionine/tyrosine aminotransferase
LNYKDNFKSEELRNIINKKIGDNPIFDKKFCYSLLSETGICSIPLSSFNSSSLWFRITLLEDNFEKFEKTLNTIKSFILKIKK